ncbi:MAG: ATP-binding protein [Acidobacteria bacterium]|nr:ATP-binding protein [Acidobacteriota bacterium]
MRFTTWPVAALALGGLLLLVMMSVLAASRRAQEIYTQLDQLNTHHRNVDTKLRRLRADVHLSGIFVRDYLLDTARERAPEYREQLAEFRRTNMSTVAELRALARGRRESDEQILGLQAKLDEYWQTFDPLFDWTPAEKILQSARFLRREVLPRREAVLTITEEIEQLNNANLTAQQAEVTRRHAALRSDLYKLLWRSLLLGLVVALTAVIRLRVLERRSEEQRRTAQEAEHQMRDLSQQLVATQEEERKKLSRELHDHVGQVLTALRMELGRIDRLRAPAEARLGAAVAECRQLVDDIVHTVRDLALGLRPSMLDDLGLQPALEWHVRDFARRYGMPVDLDVDGEFDALPDQHRTCVYRVVQEALTNCVRHARPGRVHVRLTGDPEGLNVSVTDDGVGFDPAQRHTGMGLRGIEERVRELGGVMAVHSAPGAGTTLSIRLPLAIRTTEAALANTGR